MLYKYKNLYFYAVNDFEQCFIMIKCKDNKFLKISDSEYDEIREICDSIADSAEITEQAMYYQLESHYVSFDECMYLAEQAETHTAQEMLMQGATRQKESVNIMKIALVDTYISVFDTDRVEIQCENEESVLLSVDNVFHAVCVTVLNTAQSVESASAYHFVEIEERELEQALRKSLINVNFVYELVNYAVEHTARETAIYAVKLYADKYSIELM